MDTYHIIYNKALSPTTPTMTDMIMNSITSNQTPVNQTTIDQIIGYPSQSQREEHALNDNLRQYQQVRYLGQFPNQVQNQSSYLSGFIDGYNVNRVNTNNTNNINVNNGYVQTYARPVNQQPNQHPTVYIIRRGY
jgi:hypothetical protein